MAGLVFLIPFGELAPGEAASIRNQVIQALLAKASAELKLSQTSLVVRDIQPANDLDFSTEDWFEVTGATANAYENMTTGTMADQRYVAVYGVKDDGIPSCTLLRFNISSGNRTIWNLQGLQSINDQDERIGISPAPIIITPNAPYTISRYVRMVSSPSHIVLKGVVVEPRGRVISP